MDTDELISTIQETAKRHILPLILATLGLICLGYGLISFLQSKQEGDIIFEKADNQDVASAKTEATIVVDVQGAVEKPGVYTLSKDARIQDGLIAAGGLSKDANRLYVAKTINLAAKITDGTKIYIPFEGEQAAEGKSTAGSQTAGSGININTASLSELDSLPGIGQVTGQKIIDNRPYSTPEELKSKKVVSNSVFEKIKEKIAVY